MESIKHEPASPAPSSDEIFQNGLHHLMRHNATTSHPQEHVGPEQAIASHAPNPPSRHGTPFPQRDLISPYHYSSPYPQSVLDAQLTPAYYPGYESGHSVYGPLPNELQHPQSQHHHVPGTSPPTPPRLSNAITTRSGLSIPRGSVVKSATGKPSRIDKLGQRKKKERVKAPKKVEKLLKSLSELSRDFPDVPVADIGAYVHRPTEERLREVQQSKIPGKIKRPMNAFMLYRKAYQNLAKSLCTQNNHQIVSQVCGDGWPLEPDHIREQFNEWAKIERANHQNAHPGYKFTPSKPKKRKEDFDETDEGTDLEDMEWGPGPGGPRSKGPGKAARMEQITIEPSTPTFSNSYPSLTVPSSIGLGIQCQPVYQYTNSSKPLSTSYSPVDLAGGHYYQQGVYQRSNAPTFVEDFMIRKTPSPSLSYARPVDEDLDLVSDRYRSIQSSQVAESIIDPSLLPQDGSSYETAYGDLGGGKKWQPQVSMTETRQMPSDSLMQYDEGLLQDPQMQFFKGGEGGWQIEELDAGRSWLDQQPE